MHNYNKNVYAKNNYVKNLLSRNFYIVKYVDRVYAVGFIKNGVIEGETAYGCYAYLKNNGKELYFYDCNTNQWLLNLVKKINKPPIPFGFYAGIGTRDLPTKSIIENLYEN